MRRRPQKLNGTRGARSGTRWTGACGGLRGRAGGCWSPQGPYTRSGARGRRGSSGVGDGWARRSMLAGGWCPAGTQHRKRGQLHRLRGLRYRSLSICKARGSRRQAGSPVCVPSKAVVGWRPGPSAHPGPWAAGPERPRGPPALRPRFSALFTGPVPGGRHGQAAAAWAAVGRSGHAWCAASQTMACQSSSLFQRDLLHVTGFGATCF